MQLACLISVNAAAGKEASIILPSWCRGKYAPLARHATAPALQDQAGVGLKASD